MSAMETRWQSAPTFLCSGVSSQTHRYLYLGTSTRGEGEDVHAEDRGDQRERCGDGQQQTQLLDHAVGLQGSRTKFGGLTAFKSTVPLI